MNLKFEPDSGCRAEHSLYFWQISQVWVKIYYCWLTLGSKELNHDATLDLKNRYHLFRRVPTPPPQKKWTDPWGQIAKSDQGYAIIGISETWLSSNINDSELSINGQYTVFRSDRQTRGGGVCLLIMNSLKPRLCNELLSKNCEVVWAECNLHKCNLKICCYYRPPIAAATLFPIWVIALRLLRARIHPILNFWS